MSDPRDAIETDERPWGRFTRYAFNERCTVKIIEVEAGGVLSLQRHARRDELWVALDPGLTFVIDDDELSPSVGEPHLVPAGSVHRVRAGDASGRFLEVAFGEFDEDDIERLEDAYGRS
ncbi:MAG: phosphomannose isomerase type II C-terminal cupin domain [Actinobacteria bacterium]|nr:phosphomannose isomerase type II C-terminal cupin domain [Actinomycetota bacterium]